MILYTFYGATWGLGALTAPKVKWQPASKTRPGSLLESGLPISSASMDGQKRRDGGGGGREGGAFPCFPLNRAIWSWKGQICSLPCLCPSHLSVLRQGGGTREQTKRQTHTQLRGGGRPCLTNTSVLHNYVCVAPKKLVRLLSASRCECRRPAIYVPWCQPFVLLLSWLTVPFVIGDKPSCRGCNINHPRYIFTVDHETGVARHFKTAGNGRHLCRFFHFPKGFTDAAFELRARKKEMDRSADSNKQNTGK